MPENPLSGNVGLDTTDFKAGIAAINRDLRVVESGFRASAASLGDWAKTLDGTKMRAEALNKEIDLQKQKVTALTAEYDRIVKASGAESRAAQEMQIRLNKANEELGKSQSELRETDKRLDDLSGGMNKAGTETEKTTRKFEGLKAAGVGIGAMAAGAVAGLAAVAAAAIGAAVGIGKLVLKTAASADELDELSVKTGISVEQLQELGYVGRIIGTDLDTVTGSLSKLIRNMGEAEKAGSPAAKAFQELGISVTDSSGNLRDSTTVFNEAITALAGIKNPTEQDVLAFQIFGKGAMELNPLIRAGGDEIARLTTEAHKMGAVMSDEDVKAAADFKDQIDGLQMGLQGLVMSMVSGLMPALQGFARDAGVYLSSFSDAFKQFQEGGNTDVLTQRIAGIASGIAQEIAQQAPKMLKAGMAILEGLIKGILQTLPVLLPAVISMVNSLAQFIITAMPMLLQAGLQILMTLAQAIIQNLPMLMQTMIQLVLQLGQFIAEALPTMMPMLVQVILQIAQMLIENLPLLINVAIQIILALVNGINASMPILIEMLPTIIMAIVTALITAIPQLLQAAVQLVGALIDGLVQSIPLLIIAVLDLVGQVIKTLTGKTPDWVDVGKKMIEGLGKGIKDQWNKLKSDVTGLFNGLISWIKGLLGIASPSRVFADIGMNMALGLGKGFDSAMNGVSDRILGAMGNMTVNAPAAAQAGQAGGGAAAIGGNTYQLYFQTYDESGLVRTLRRTEMLYGA